MERKEEGKAKKERMTNRESKNKDNNDSRKKTRTEARKE
jgi:hypothetical protein